jgi:hypothetical protein
MRARAHLSILCLATLAAGCGSSQTVAPKDAAPGADLPGKEDLASPDASSGADLADKRDSGRPDAPPEAVPETGRSDAASDLALPPGDLALDGRPSDLPPGDVRQADGGSDTSAGFPVDGPGLDATVDVTSPVDGGLAGFCTGDAPRMVVNGADLTPTVAAYPIAMDCCDGGRFVVTSDALAFPIGVDWLAEAGPSYTLPATIDLASPPQGWRNQVIAGCSVTSAGCVGAHDYYQTGLVGWLTVARDASHGLDMSVCVHVEEDPAQPAYLLHSLDLYVPHALTF